MSELLTIPHTISIGDKYNPAMMVQTQQEAQAYFEACVLHTMGFGVDRAEAERLERISIGYYAGYSDYMTMQRIAELYGLNAVGAQEIDNAPVARVI